MRWASDRVLVIVGAALLALAAYWFAPIGREPRPEHPSAAGGFVEHHANAR